MLTLITKDIRALFTSGKKGDGHLLKALLTLICALLFALLEYGFLYALFTEAQSMISAPITLATWILTLISIVMTVIAFVRASKLFFNKQDTQQVSIRPISSGVVMTSRLLALAVMHCATALLFEYPVFLAYLAVYNKSLWFYYMAFAYPLLAGLCEIGIALALLYPLRLLWQYVKRNCWVRASVVVAITALVACPCAIFIHRATAIFSDGGLFGLLTDPSTTRAIDAKNYIFPIKLLIDYLFNRTNGIFPYLAISGGIFMLSANFAGFFLHRIGRSATVKPKSKERKAYKPLPLWKYLLKKALILRFSDPLCSLAYPILLILQPYMLYLIARICNASFGSSEAIIPSGSLFANISPLVITLAVVLVTLAIYALASTRSLISSTAAKPYDLINPSHKAMMISKTFIPLAASTLFLIISILTLLISGMLSPLDTLFTFLESVTALLTVATVSWQNIRDPRLEHPKFYYTSTVFSCSFIIISILFGSLLTVIRCPVWAIYLIETVAFLALGALPAQKTLIYAKTVVQSKKN